MPVDYRIYFRHADYVPRRMVVSYAVLDLQPGVPVSDIKLQYRKKSLLIHPDKTSNPQAPEAFDRLRKAQTSLTEDKERERLDEAIADARHLLMREKKLTVDSEDLRTDAFKREWREKTKMVLIDNEARRRRQMKAQLAEEGRQQRKQEEEDENRKRKREHESQWEETRDNRISSWRDFKKGVGKVGGGGGGGGGTTSGEKDGQAAAVATKTKKKKMKPIG
ncbi:MAG: hypothetical protein M1815_004442 [Lichina confinis]|nr:MAG: hypothetical protein M1815_004442 [Lichina confinis]